VKHAAAIMTADGAIVVQQSRLIKNSHRIPFGLLDTTAEQYHHKEQYQATGSTLALL
jgi:hypothetical protein